MSEDYYFEKRPWGFFEDIKREGNYKVKKLKVDPNKKLSYQSHRHREEIWVIVKGDGTFILNGKEQKIHKKSIVQIPKGAKHRVIAGKQGLEIIEVQLGDILKEDDITRFEDDYGRA